MAMAQQDEVAGANGEAMVGGTMSNFLIGLIGGLFSGWCFRIAYEYFRKTHGLEEK